MLMWLQTYDLVGGGIWAHSGNVPTGRIDQGGVVQRGVVVRHCGDVIGGRGACACATA